MREVLNAVFHVLSTGCQWKALPIDLPPKSTAHYYFMLWDWDGTLDRVHHTLYVAVREQAGREASPSVAIIDSQSGKAAHMWNGPAGKCFFQMDHHAGTVRSYVRPFSAAFDRWP